MRNVILLCIVSSLIFAGSAVFAQEPVLNVSPKHHPNLAAAQELCRKAYDRIEKAERAAEWDSEGHAQNAKELLDKVNTELKLAAKAVNREKSR
jgi:hypothetical protein